MERLRRKGREKRPLLKKVINSILFSSNYQLFSKYHFSFKVSVFLQLKPHINCKGSHSFFQNHHGVNLKFLDFRKITDKP